MSVTHETKDELRRLHAEHRDITKTIAHFEPVTAGIPDDLAAQYERTTDAVLGLVHLHMGDLLDALAAAEAERDRLRAVLRAVAARDDAT